MQTQAAVPLMYWPYLSQHGKNDGIFRLQLLTLIKRVQAKPQTHQARTLFAPTKVLDPHLDGYRTAQAYIGIL